MATLINLLEDMDFWAFLPWFSSFLVSYFVFENVHVEPGSFAGNGILYVPERKSFLC